MFENTRCNNSSIARHTLEKKGRGIQVQACPRPSMGNADDSQGGALVKQILVALYTWREEHDEDKGTTNSRNQDVIKNLVVRLQRLIMPRGRD